MTTVKSLNISTFVNKNAVKENVGKPLVNISGVVTGLIIVKGKYGDIIGFEGAFIGTNLLTGEIKESSAAFITPRETARLHQLVDNVEAEGRVVEIEINIDMGAMESVKSPTGFAWVAFKSLSEQQTSRFELMRNKAVERAGQLKALPASKTK